MFAVDQGRNTFWIFSKVKFSCWFRVVLKVKLTSAIVNVFFSTDTKFAQEKVLISHLRKWNIGHVIQVIF